MLVAILGFLAGCSSPEPEAVVVPVRAKDTTSGGEQVVIPASKLVASVEAEDDQSQGPHFVGSQSCRSCHGKFYELWSTSHHGLAMQTFGPKLAAEIAPQEKEVAVGDVTYRAEMSAEGAFVREKGPEGEKQYPILHTLGGKNVYYFLTELERGKLQVLPVAYDVHTKEWYDTAASGMRHFERVRDDVVEEPVHWRDREYTFNTSCHGCHVSQVQTNYDLTSDSYRHDLDRAGDQLRDLPRAGQ